MNAANKQGPAKSPMTFGTPRADSVKADAHCAIVLSEAPEQTMRRMSSQKSGNLISFPGEAAASLIGSLLMGHTKKLNVFAKGIKAQMRAAIFQFSTPNTLKKIVEPMITATAPQQ